MSLNAHHINGARSYKVKTKVKFTYEKICNTKTEAIKIKQLIYYLMLENGLRGGRSKGIICKGMITRIERG